MSARYTPVKRAVDTPAAPQLNPRPFLTTFCSFLRSVEYIASHIRRVSANNEFQIRRDDQKDSLPAQTSVTGKVTTLNLSFRSLNESSMGFFTCPVTSIFQLAASCSSTFGTAPWFRT